MIPSELAYNVASLHPNRENCALTFAAKLSDDGTILQYRIAPSLIQNLTRMNYNDADSMIISCQQRFSKHAGNYLPLHHLQQRLMASKKSEEKMNRQIQLYKEKEQELEYEEQNNKLRWEITKVLPTTLVVVLYKTGLCDDDC